MTINIAIHHIRNVTARRTTDTAVRLLFDCGFQDSDMPSQEIVLFFDNSIGGKNFGKINAHNFAARVSRDGDPRPSYNHETFMGRIGDGSGFPMHEEFEGGAYFCYNIEESRGFHEDGSKEYGATVEFVGIKVVHDLEDGSECLDKDAVFFTPDKVGVLMTKAEIDDWKEFILNKWYDTEMHSHDA